MFEVKVSGVVHALDDIYNTGGYARSTFTTIENLDALAVGASLKFRFNKPFYTDDIDKLLNELIKGEDHSNVDWTLSIVTSKKVRVLAKAA